MDMLVDPTSARNVESTYKGLNWCNASSALNCPTYRNMAVFTPKELIIPKTCKVENARL